jgi:DNA replication and repair protein RecF
MKIERINITHLRNHNQTELEFSGGLNIFHGLNGSGKTSVLEAISICAFSKTFHAVKDNSLIQNEFEFYNVFLNARNDYGIPYFVAVKNPIDGKKEIKSSFGDNLNPKELIGELPLVILYPDNKSITLGSPADRRDFIDRLLSQSSRIYLNELIKLKKILKQRNNILYQSKSDYHSDKQNLEVWTEMLIKSSATISFRRAEFIKDFRPFFYEAYSFIAGSKESVNIEYLPQGLANNIFSGLNVEEIENYYQEYSKSVSRDELRRGVTLFGPQRDEIEISINHGIAKEIASQGQHKSLLIAMKFSEFNFLKTVKNETPVALLDDIFSELDRERALKTLNLLHRNYAQIFITLTDIELLLPIIPTDIDYKTFMVQDGRVIDESK